MLVFFAIFSEYWWFQTKLFTGLLEFIINSIDIKQNPLQKIFIFTIYQNYTLALTLWSLDFTKEKLLNFDVCVVHVHVCIIMFRWINKQPGIQKIWNQYMYVIISKILNITINHQVDGLFYFGRWWKVSDGKSGYLSFFTSLRHLMMLLKCNFFQGFIFTPYQRHWSIALTPCRSDFLKWKQC